MESSNSEKNLLKPLETTIFWPNFCKNGGHGQHPKQKTIVFAEITKPDHRLSKPFYFIKIYVLVEFWMFFYFVWCFLSKSVFSSHTAVYHHEFFLDCFFAEGEFFFIQSFPGLLFPKIFTRNIIALLSNKNRCFYVVQQR